MLASPSDEISHIATVPPPSALADLFPGAQTIGVSPSDTPSQDRVTGETLPKFSAGVSSLGAVAAPLVLTSPTPGAQTVGVSPSDAPSQGRVTREVLPEFPAVESGADTDSREPAEANLAPDSDAPARVTVPALDLHASSLSCREWSRH